MSEFPIILAICFGVMTAVILLFIGLGVIISHMKNAGWYMDTHQGEELNEASRRVGDIRDT